jgi:tRNA A-37 threonylcarbamoyl transferase component Bud32
MGRERSYHGVFLGVMRAQSADGAVAQERFVAVKPFMLHEGAHVVQELNMTQRVREEGLTTLNPLGVIVDRWGDPPRMFIVTDLMQELSSLAAKNWHNLQPEDVANRMRQVVNTLAVMHTKGLVHGDPQFKNIGIGESEDQQIVYDLEDGVSIRDLLEQTGPDDPVPERLVRLLAEEFRRVRISMREFIYPNLPEGQRPVTAEDRFMFELNALFEPYHQALHETETPHRDVLDRVYRTILEKVRAGDEPPLKESIGDGRMPRSNP